MNGANRATGIETPSAGGGPDESGPGPDKPLRLFAGVRVSVDTARALAEAQKQMAAAGRGGAARVKWVAPASLHVTLKFLGWTRPPVVDAVRDAGARALSGAQSLRMTCKGAGAFPDPRRARVIWAGIDDGGRLSPLAQALDRAMAELGFTAETRPFHAHVTLGRLREPGDVSALIATQAAQIFSETWVESVILFESVTKSTGAEYSTLAEWPLQGPRRPRKRQTESVQIEAEREGTGLLENGRPKPVENLADHDSEDLDGSAAE